MTRTAAYAAALLTGLLLSGCGSPPAAKSDARGGVVAAGVGSGAKPTAPAQGGVGATDAKAASPAPAASPLP